MQEDLHDKPVVRRRSVVEIGLALVPLWIARAHAEDEASAPPQRGDHFVYLSGPNKGAVVKSADLEAGGPQIQAYPTAPDGTVRDGSRLNLVLLARVGAEGLSKETASRAAEGVVAYSGVCTHQACPVNMWSQELNAFVCSCHASTFDPRNSAQVVSGPAPRPLAALPLMSENGVIYVASGFTRKVGATPV